jgi:hypothetical protein
MGVTRGAYRGDTECLEDGAGSGLRHAEVDVDEVVDVNVDEVVDVDECCCCC